MWRASLLCELNGAFTVLPRWFHQVELAARGLSTVGTEFELLIRLEDALDAEAMAAKARIEKSRQLQRDRAVESKTLTAMDKRAEAVAVKQAKRQQEQQSLAAKLREAERQYQDRERELRERRSMAAIDVECSEEEKSYRRSVFLAQQAEAARARIVELEVLRYRIATADTKMIVVVIAAEGERDRCTRCRKDCC